MDGLFPAAPAPAPPGAAEAVQDENDMSSVDPQAPLPEASEELLDALLEEEDKDEMALWCNDDGRIMQMISLCLADFDSADDDSKISQDAAEIARNSITQGTQTQHQRDVKQYIVYHLKRDPKWNAKAVSKDTPHHIRMFIQYKCGPVDQGYKGCRYATAVSIRAALTYWYRHVQKIHDTSEWRVDDDGRCHGLPTRSQAVARYMLGLQKAKAKAGEISQPMKAMTASTLSKIYDAIVASERLTNAQRRQGIVRYNAYLIAFLMMLRVDEVMSLHWRDIGHVPGEDEWLEITLPPRKASQTGTSGRWRLWANDIKPYLCPKRMRILLVSLYGAAPDRNAPMFVQVDDSGALLMNKPMTAAQLSRSLQHDLRTIGETKWHLYRTHSFRRGGAQYRLEQGWSTGKVAQWGGWSQVEAITMFRYFWSPGDFSGFMHHFDRNAPLPAQSIRDWQMISQQRQMQAAHYGQMPYTGF
ncbi:hypothetical protein PsYK624_144900 [Phanerochaete sordida]|uniref:Tyr recombinase domain-containing protein n=1 Tax=Phanerochaete sordida TaxID=48140 RepID=A0A9P3GQ27_9APHY|nr:hypothetical protein PsYK624_144900 [Phanerochaete sordida]